MIVRQTIHPVSRRLLPGIVAAASLMTPLSAPAAVDIAQVPLQTVTQLPPMNLLVMSRDHRLYYGAYTNAPDLNGDGQPNIRYEPEKIDYFGYFDSHKCYAYVNGVFAPRRTTPDKRCNGGDGDWSGDWLNYMTTSRIDALRKVLYGGKREIDSRDRTVLKRAYVPQDAHTWGGEYTSPAVDGYNIRHYTPLSVPIENRRHLFASTTLGLRGDPPLLRILRNSTYRHWHWTSREALRAGVGGDSVWVNRENIPVNPENYVVRVEVCRPGLLESNCQSYNEDHAKPVGLLQEYGESGRMLFGLLTGTYQQNLSGGVLRKPIGDISNEINPDTGQFTRSSGIIDTIDRLSIVDYFERIADEEPDAYAYGLGWPTAWVSTQPAQEGWFPDWGNPIAEMMYEGMRYFAGAGAPTPEFTIDEQSVDSQRLGLTTAEWDDPYADRPYCARGAQTVISDINPSYDTDQIPGSAFSSFTGDGSLPGLNASSLGTKIWQAEHGGARQVFIGEAPGQYDGTPSPKWAGSFGDIRGLAPEEPTKMGGYYSASVAHYGRITDLRPDLPGDQSVPTYTVALASPLPRINIPVGGDTVTIIPFGKTVAGICPADWGLPNPDPSQGAFQPTTTIVSVLVEELTPTTGSFRISFEDMEQGADHDMDAYVHFSYRVLDNRSVNVRMRSAYESGACLTMHLGYIVSGTTTDGTYLEVRNRSISAEQDTSYFLDTGHQSAEDPGWKARFDAGEIQGLPLETSRVFTASGRPAAELLQDPLWYSAKYGGFSSPNGETMPRPDGSNWDQDGDGTPDNYFPVTNALGLRDQLANAFESIYSETTSSSAAAVTPQYMEYGNLLYRARYLAEDWSGEIKAFEVDDQGDIVREVWDAEQQLPAAQARRIYTYSDADGAGPRYFSWQNLSEDQRLALQGPAHQTGDNPEALAQQRLDWLRGDTDGEQRNGGSFRNRERRIGDIVNSDPLLINIANRGHARLPGREGATYTQSRLNWARDGRTPILAVGANNGMLHLFDGETGDEILAYVPDAVFPELWRLTEPDYHHRYYMDGKLTVEDAFIAHEGARQWRTLLLGTTGAGGRAVFALDVTEPRRTMAPQEVVRWEFTHPELGYTIGQPSIARLPSGRWVAIFGNGYNSRGNRAQLFVVDVATGELIRRLDTGVGGGVTPNGLATPAVIDSTNDLSPDLVYAGDLLGNLWEFDLQDADPERWSLRRVFQATNPGGNPQPITSYPEVGRHPRGGLMVMFGTGSLFRLQDQDDRSVQSFYGLRIPPADDSATTLARGDLQQQRIVQETTADGARYRLTSDDEATPGRHGWYLDLVRPNGDPQGERAVNRPLLDSGRILFTTLIPSEDICQPGGDGWLMVMDAYTGARLDYAVFDINDDGFFGDGDLFTSPEGPDAPGVTASGRRRPGHLSTPSLIRGDTMDAVYTAGEDDAPTMIRSAYERGRQSWRERQP